MTGAIIAFGSNLLPQNTLKSISQGQIEDLDRFASVIHFGDAEITGPGASDRLAPVARTSSFDALMKRGLFGVNAQRLDLYTITGEPLYATSGSAPALQGSMLTAFDDAINNRPSSIHMEPDAAKARLGVEANLLQTYKLIWDQPPGNGRSARTLMVAAITTDVGRDLGIAHKSVWLIAGVFNAGMVLVLLVLHWASGRAHVRLEQATRALAFQNRAVRDSRERMVQAADSTKRAIAEELHGTVQSKLFAVWMQLCQFKNSRTEATPHEAGELDKIAEELDNIREHDIRGISHRLHPSIVRVGAAVGLRSLRNFYDSMIPVELEINEAAARLEPAGSSVIPDAIRLGVYRVAELAMGNVAKHAEATQCKVGWSYDEANRQLEMTITDDGIGFDPAKFRQTGLGMVNIGDYADAMNATLEIDSEPGQGTRCKLSIPFEAPVTEKPQIEPGYNVISETGEQPSAA
ncbi:MAG: ATP-binding protein [Dehalococcoidia bacterium]|nr:ATP-binding protein [Dehalococcoidia bacterium]